MSQLKRAENITLEKAKKAAEAKASELAKDFETIQKKINTLQTEFKKGFDSNRGTSRAKSNNLPRRRRSFDQNYQSKAYHDTTTDTERDARQVQLIDRIN